MMQTCKACGSECRKAQVALVLPAGKRGRVCKRCAATGLLVVASTVAPVMRQEPLFSSDPVNEVARTVRTWARLIGSEVEAGAEKDSNEATALFDTGRKQAFEAVLQLIQRTKETGT